MSDNPKQSFINGIPPGLRNLDDPEPPDYGARGMSFDDPADAIGGPSPWAQMSVRERQESILRLFREHGIAYPEDLEPSFLDVTCSAEGEDYVVNLRAILSKPTPVPNQAREQ